MERLIAKLWQKEDDSSSDLYADLFKNAMKLQIDVKQAAGKSNAVADKHRNDGNKLFTQKKWIEAVEEYNQSLCYAETGTESMSIAYANRSSCFLHLEKYDFCLRDIELAIKANYPQRLMAKIAQRKADCLKLTASDKKSGPATVKLSYGESATILGMANVLKIEQNVEFGRHIVAKCDIPVGKTVLVEPYYVLTIEGGTSHCSTCQAIECNLIPCENCTIAMFCSAACLEHGRVFHDMECGYVFGKEAKFCVVRHTLRTIFLGLDACQSVDGLMEFVENVRLQQPNIRTSLVDPKDKYRAFLQLNVPSCVESYIPCYVSLSNCALRRMKAVPKMAQLVNSLDKERFFMHLITTHLIRLSNNQNKDSTYKGKSKSMCAIGLVYPLFNHQCNPSVFVFNKGNKNVCITARPIKKGEQVFVSYLYFDETNSRQILNDKYGFSCECTKCIRATLPKQQFIAITADENVSAIELYLQRNSIDNLNDLRVFMMTEKVSERERIKNHCVKFLNKFGHLPFDETLDYVTLVFYQCIELEYEFNNDE